AFATPPATCNPTRGDGGVCIQVVNSTGSPVTTASAGVVVWQCYMPYSGVFTGSNDYPQPFNPSNPNAFEGQHCILDPSIGAWVIACPIVQVDISNQFPAGGLQNNDSVWVDINFSTNGLLGCTGSTFVGADVLFREPSQGDE